MFTPEFGKTDVTVEQFTVVMCIWILGAGSAEVTCLRANSVFGKGSVILSGGICIDFAVKEAGCLYMTCSGKATPFVTKMADLVVGRAMCSMCGLDPHPGKW